MACNLRAVCIVYFGGMLTYLVENKLQVTGTRRVCAPAGEEITQKGVAVITHSNSDSMTCLGVVFEGVF